MADVPVLTSEVNPRGEEFKANRAAMLPLVADLKQRVAHNAQGGGESARARHVARGKRCCRASAWNCC